MSAGRVPDPGRRHPIDGWAGTVFLQAVVDHPLIEVGAYSYYDDPDEPHRFVEKCVRYHFPQIGDRLVIGRFCAVAAGAQFVMNGANHPLGGFSTYPFPMLGFGEAAALDPALVPSRGDTVVGHDVWIGTEATVLPGITVGSGAIVAAKAVVSRDVPPYAVVAGNPARVVRMRFDDRTIAALLRLAWWDWPADRIARAVPAILGADLARLEAAT